jgi:BMFP domain-containing protein YqiC
MQKITLAVLLGIVAASAACASAQAKAPAERPSLEVPVPPTRMIEPTPRPEPAQLEPVPELPPAAPPNPRPRPAPKETPRTDPKPEAPAAEVAPPVAPVTPPPQLRTASTADAAEAERQVRAIMESANKALGAITFQRLDKGQKEQYDYAKRMIAESEEKLKESKVEIARDLATKAEKIAKGLPAR